MAALRLLRLERLARERRDLAVLLLQRHDACPQGMGAGARMERASPRRSTKRCARFVSRGVAPRWPKRLVGHETCLIESPRAQDGNDVQADAVPRSRDCGRRVRSTGLRAALRRPVCLELVADLRRRRMRRRAAARDRPPGVVDPREALRRQSRLRPRRRREHAGRLRLFRDQRARRRVHPDHQHEQRARRAHEGARPRLRHGHGRQRHRLPPPAHPPDRRGDGRLADRRRLRAAPLVASRWRAARHHLHGPERGLGARHPLRRRALRLGRIDGDRPARRAGVGADLRAGVHLPAELQPERHDRLRGDRLHRPARSDGLRRGAGNPRPGLRDRRAGHGDPGRHDRERIRPRLHDARPRARLARLGCDRRTRRARGLAPLRWERESERRPSRSASDPGARVSDQFSTSASTAPACTAAVQSFVWVIASDRAALAFAASFCDSATRARSRRALVSWIGRSISR